ncbi:acyl-CoA dehydrogenase family protein [Stigmatella hybrida]|uniref:acyl-CoA dehydrogenase family protein n=1 Tax=Stigmatella hybrida TaxID=394097 RepID=UPI001CDAB66F|nr:acyl-CoA dehydrogenase [Stigmatella hybrida]
MNGLYASTLAQLEQRLGPVSGQGPLGQDATLARDEREAFPAEALTALRAHGVPDLLVPASEGGQFVSFEGALAVGLTLARRDPSVALSQGMLCWLWLAWMVGSPGQRERARALLQGTAAPCFAASEANHGADLLATETLALSRPEGWEVTGEKWPIGRASHAAFAFVLARTRPAPGPRALSWFLVELDQPSVTRLPKVRTVGLRASDLSGLRFARAAASPVGEEGQGLELTLKIFQLTRPLMAGLGLGTGDMALRVATRFALERELYRASAASLPSVRRLLVGAWLRLLAAEILLLSGVRALHGAPGQASLSSPLAKAIAPALVEQAIRSATTVLGARAFMREGPAAIFQKMARDHAAVGLIDGSEPVCLHALAAELPQVFTANAGSGALLRSRFSLEEPVPAFAPASLGLTARGVDDVTAELPPGLLPHWSALRQGGSEALRGPARLETARRYGLLHAAACCFHFERFNPGLALCRAGVPALAGQFLMDPEALPETACREIFDLLAARVEGGHLLSVADVSAGPASETALVG